MPLFPNSEFSMSLSVSVNSRKGSNKPPKSASTRVRGIGQTSHSKRMVRNSLYRLESQHGKHNLAFVTCTLSDDIDDIQLWVIQQMWGEITRLHLEAINNKLKAAGIKPELVCVTEIQEKRHERSGRLCPHLHIVFQSRRNRYAAYAITKEENTAIWNRIIRNVLKRAGYKDEEIPNMPYACEIKTIEKSAQAYMAKYMSKGSSTVRRVDKDKSYGDVWFPKSWWNVSLSLREWVKENTKILADRTKRWIKDNLHHWIEDLENSPFHYLHIVTIDVQDRTTGADIKLPVAVVGRIKKYHLHKFETKDLNALNPFQAYPQFHVV